MRHVAGVLRHAQREGAAAVASRVPASMTVTDWLDAQGEVTERRELVA